MSKDNMANHLGAVTKRKHKLGNKKLKNVKMFEDFDPETDVVSEKWDGDSKVKSTGENSGKTIEQLEKEAESLRAKDDKTEAESKKLRQINFAIRAKRKFKGDAK